MRDHHLYARMSILIPALLSAIVLAASYRVPALTHDSVTYLQIARNVLTGGELGWQALWAPPFHSLLIAAASYGSGVHDLLLVVSLLAPLTCFLLVITVYLLAEELFDRTVAVMAASLCGLSPHLVNIAYSPEPEITYTALLTVSLLLYLRAVVRHSSGYAALSGVAFALAYMSRSEGVLILVFVLAATAWTRRRIIGHAPLRRVYLVTILLFSLVSLPYLVFLARNYGAVVISPKTSYVISWLKHAELQIQDAENPDIWGMDRSGKLNWQVPKGIADLLAPFLAEPRKNISRYLHGLATEIPGRIPNGSGMDRYPQLIPFYLFAAALASLFVPWGEHRKEKRAVLFAPLLIVFVLPLFTSGWWKYLVPYFPLVTIAAAKGFAGWGEWIGSRAGGGLLRFVPVAVCAGAVILIGGRYVYRLIPAAGHPGPMSLKNIEKAQYADVTRNLGMAARSFFGPGRNYMAKWSKTIYYLDGRWTPFPLGSHDDVIAYARKHTVDYIVLEINDPQKMKSVHNPLPGVSLVKTFESQEYIYMLAFFRVLD